MNILTNLFQQNAYRHTEEHIRISYKWRYVYTLFTRSLTVMRLENLFWSKYKKYWLARSFLTWNLVQFRCVLGLELTLQNIKFSSDFRDYNVQATFFSNRKSSLVIFPLGKDKVCKRIKWPRFCPSPWAINIIINANLSSGHLRKHKHFHLLAIFCIYEKCFPV